MSSALSAGSAPAISHRFTLVNGRTFTLADHTGGFCGPMRGAVFEDLRYLSEFTITVAGREAPLSLEPLSIAQATPFSLTATMAIDEADEPLAGGALIHRVVVGRGSRHTLEVRNLGSSAATWSVGVTVGADFAHIFEVKNRTATGDSVPLILEPDGRLVLTGGDRETRIVCSEVPSSLELDDRCLSWTVDCAPGTRRSISIACEPVVGAEPAGILFPVSVDPSEVIVEAPHDPDRPQLVATDPKLVEAFDVANADLESLRIYDPAAPDTVVVAAGAPWFMTLFGRDSLLTSWMALPFAPQLATGTLTALSRLQGTEVNPSTEEAPGKIIHEVRRSDGSASFADRGRYYGSVDATPLFVMVAAEAWRWGALREEQLDALWSSIVRAVTWIEAGLRADPRGFLSYHRSTGEGLTNQGWKDSWDGITGADGAVPTGPLAVVEAQGYAFAALCAAADLADHRDDGRLDAGRLRRTADDLADRFNARYWSDRLDGFVLALDGGGNQVETLTTNPGHAIWCGITDAALADRYLDRCLQPDMASGWGLRTLSAEAAAYHPLSYHNGSVWPHDTALVAAGAAAAGRMDVATSIIHAAVDAANAFDGRPPELFAGFARTDVPTPVVYPASCSPQAWASASVLLNVRTMLDLQPGQPPTVDDDRWGPILALDGVHSHGQRTRLTRSG